MKTIFYQFNRWFEINVGWLFVNGNKVTYYENYIKEKYFKNKKYIN